MSFNTQNYQFSVGMHSDKDVTNQIHPVNQVALKQMQDTLLLPCYSWDFSTSASLSVEMTVLNVVAFGQ